MAGKLARICCCCCTKRNTVDAKRPVEDVVDAGNLRNKHALPPGHSLMDWIRLGASGTDLTGVGPQAGHLPVTPRELSLHNKETDVWLSIRGRVYNVTAYLPFHPGGPEQLMKGAGRDATSLFEEVHPWVNFDQILSKCLVGPLKSHLDIDASQLFKSEKESAPQPPSPAIFPTKEPMMVLPRFDWIQKLDYITVIFYLGSYSNPSLEMKRGGDERTSHLVLTYSRNAFVNEIAFFAEVEWPCRAKVTCETGKIEVIFRKGRGGVWENFGLLKQKIMDESSGESKSACRVVNKVKVNYNTFLLELERCDGSKGVVPLGKHLKVFATLNGRDFSRSYTPVPGCLFTGLSTQTYTTDNICLMVKRYPNGNVSSFLGDLLAGDVVTVSKPEGPFNLQEVERRETFIVLAAGTGITPMLSIILFLLERRLRKCQGLRLMFFNKTQDDILFKKQFEELQNSDGRFKVQHVLSQPDESWTGLKGHISRTILEDTITSHVKDTTYAKQDIYFMACGPTTFTILTHQLFKDLQIKEEQVHLFTG